MSGIIYNSCDNYVYAVNSALTVADWVVAKPLNCSYQLTKGFVKTIGFVYREGAKGCANETIRGAKWLSGISNFADGIDAFKLNHLKERKILTTDNPNEPKVVVSNEVTDLPDERSFMTRVGEMGGHFAVGASKIGYATAYVVGTTTNALGIRAEDMFQQGVEAANTKAIEVAKVIPLAQESVTNLGTTMIKGAQVLSEITHASANLAFETAKVTFEAAKIAAPTIKDQAILLAKTYTKDSTAFCITAAATGVLGGMYVSSKGFMGIANADNWKDKATYSAMMVSGWALTAGSAAFGVLYSL